VANASLHSPFEKRADDSPADSSPLESNLSSTLQAFRSRIQHKRREQASEDERTQRAARSRQAVLLQAMTKIRKSLTEVSRIDLGDQYTLDLEADDLQGWPRIVVSLVSRANPREEFPRLKILSHDRQASGSIEIQCPGLPLEKFSVVRENDVKQLPFALKKAVRTFLDVIGEIVLSTAAEENEPHAIQLAGESLEETAKRPDSIVGDEENLFDDTFDDKEVFEKLPELDELSTLPPADRD
jgi:hypothetical protein